jgi:hypothetical protein
MDAGRGAGCLRHHAASEVLVAEIKQWVNLDPGVALLRDVPGEGKIPPERCGPIINLKAKINRKKAAKRVYWGVELGASNVEKKADHINLLGGWALAKTKGGFGAKGFYERLVPTNAKGESITQFRLSDCGGDEFVVKAYTKTPKGKIKKELKSDTYIVWRQLYYEVTRMGPSVGKVNLPAIPDIPWSDVTQEYDDTRKPHNIRWSKVPAKKEVITRHRSLYDDTLTKRTGVEGYDRAREPMVLKVSLVDLMAEKRVEVHTLEVEKAKTVYTYDLPQILFDVNSADDKDDWFVSATACRADKPSVGIAITKDDFTKVGPASISVRLAEIPHGCGERGVKATATITVNVFTGWGLGLSWYNGIWAIDGCATWPAPPAAPFISQASAAGKVGTMVHEFGHAIGMVPTASPKHYIKHDHVGNHCWNGATDPSTLATVDTPFPQPTGAVCTMFGDDSSGTEQFCDICSPFVRSRNPGVDGKFKPSTMMPTTW